MQKLDNSSENLTTSDSLEQHQSTFFSILTIKNVEIDKKFLLKFTKENFKTINREAKRNCKIIQFPSNLSFEEVLAEVAKLNGDEYPNLFTFIIETENVGFNLESRALKCFSCCICMNNNNFFNDLKNVLLKIGYTRPLILQLTSEKEESTKFYYKNEYSKYFQEVDKLKNNFEKFKNFSSFLMTFLSGDIQSIKEFIISNFSNVKNKSLILRFLRTLNLSEDFFETMVLKCAECGSKNDLLAVLDAPLDDDGRNLSEEAQIYLSDVIYVDPSSNESTDDQEQSKEEESESTEEDSSNVVSSVSSNRHLNTSVLLTAVENKNKEIINFLIFNWTHLIQQLPFKHQVRISTAAFETRQYDVLCDLLDVADFPFFAENYEFHSINHTKLSGIAKERNKFSNAIKSSLYEEMKKFIEENRYLKIVYNTANVSALKKAVDLKNYEVYVYLISFDFKASEFKALEKVLSPVELKKANKCIADQRKKNVNEALQDEEKSVYLLLMRSLIHNRKISKTKEAEYRAKIKKWYEEIKKLKSGSELLDAAASCEFLKIIFDFESETVKNASLRETNAAGSTYPVSKWIFIGAKLSDEKREQQIKGVLAHELCHYVMKLVFENDEHPYYKHRDDIAKTFDGIVKVVDKWSATDSEEDDECNGIISSVFTEYTAQNFHPELIVRVVQILAEFDDNEEKLKNLKLKYKILFDFWQDFIYPELVKFDHKGRENVRKLNNSFELLEDIKSENFEFPATDTIKKLFDNKVLIVTTNISKLLLINIYNFLKNQFGDLLDAHNLFVDPGKLKNQKLNDFKTNLTDNLNLNIFVDCTMSQIPESLDCIFTNSDVNLIFIVCDAEHLRNRILSMIKYDIKPTEVNMTYNCIKLQNQSLEPNSSSASKFLSKLNLQIKSQILSSNEAIPNIPFENVTISNIQIDNDSAKLVEIFKRFENSIEFMSLEYVKISDVNQLQEIFSGLSNLKTLNLHACSIDKFNSERLPPIPSLKSVTFNECDGNFFAIIKNQISIEKIEVCSYEWKTTTFSYNEFEALAASLPNLHHLVFDGTGTGLYFEYGKFPYKIRKLNAFMINFWWNLAIPRVNFLKLQQGHLKELAIQKLPYDYDGGEVLKFIIEEMELDKFYYGTIPLILDGKKQEVARLVAAEVQIFSTFEMFRQFTSIQTFTLFLTYTNIEMLCVEQILKSRTDVFENLRDLDVLDHSGTKHLFPLYTGLYKNCRNITRLSFRTDDESINSVFRECLQEMTQLREIFLWTRNVKSMERLITIRDFAPRIQKLSVAEQFVPQANRFFKNEVEVIGLKMNMHPECFNFN